MIQYSSTGLRLGMMDPDGLKHGLVAVRVAEEVMVHNTVARVPVNGIVMRRRGGGGGNDAQYSCMAIIY